MTNPTYNVNISYYPARPIGQKLVNVSGVTSSVMAYTDGYFIASMPELKISATGSEYVDALNNVLSIATASTTVNPGYNPLSNIRTW
jgi:hypothetical protein